VSQGDFDDRNAERIINLIGEGEQMTAIEEMEASKSNQQTSAGKFGRGSMPRKPMCSGSKNCKASRKSCRRFPES
jgi:hypothetical protein